MDNREGSVQAQCRWAEVEQRVSGHSAAEEEKLGCERKSVVWSRRVAKGLLPLGWTAGLLGWLGQLGVDHWYAPRWRPGSPGA